MISIIRAECGCLASKKLRELAGRTKGAILIAPEEDAPRICPYCSKGEKWFEYVDFALEHTAKKHKGAQVFVDGTYMFDEKHKAAFIKKAASLQVITVVLAERWKTLEEYENYYDKLFSSLDKESKSKLHDLVCNVNPVIEMDNSIDWEWEPLKGTNNKEKKENWCHGMLAGHSLDYLEYKANTFSLEKLDENTKARHYILFLSSKRENFTLSSVIDLTTALCERIDKLSGNDGTNYAAFAFHDLDAKDYILIGHGDNPDFKSGDFSDF